MSRADRQLPEPARDLERFPRRTLPSGSTVYRSHSATRRPWWFASAPPEPQDGGRFDLRAPEGTCYVAFDVETAVRERFGEEILASGMVSEAAVHAGTVSTLALQEEVVAADAAAPAAANFITRELSSVHDYGLTQRWAAAFAHEACTGVLYQSRFSTGADQFALALFGEAGERTWPVEGEEDVREILSLAGVVVAKPATRAVLTRSTRHLPAP